MIWTPEIEADLKRRWTTTADSASRIAEIYGTTKNAIIGKCRRLELQRYKKKKVARPSSRWDKGARPSSRDNTDVVKAPLGVSSHAKEVVETPLLAVLPTRVVPTPSGEGVHLYDLEGHHCRWPRDEDKSRYCGEPKERGSYCAEHGALAYRGSHFVTGKKSPYPHQKPG